MDKIKQDDKFIVTARCVHSKTKLHPSCNIKKIKEDKLLTKEQINGNLSKYSQLKKCGHCLAFEDYEIIG